MAFPSSSQFSPVIVAGQPSFDLVGDESPASTDIVGNASFPSFYYAYDGINVYFRLRLNDDPRNNAKTAFQTFSWGVLFNTGGVAGTYEWLLAVNGNAARLDLIQNTNKQFNTWNDPAEGTDGRGTPNFSRPIINFDVARVTLTDSAGNVIARIETELNGRFTISDLPPGQYTLIALALGYITSNKTVVVLGGEVVNIVIPLQKKKSLKMGFILISRRTGRPLCLSESSCPTVFNFVCKSCSNCATLSYEIEFDNRTVQSSLIVDLCCFTLVQV